MFTIQFTQQTAGLDMHSAIIGAASDRPWSDFGGIEFGCNPSADVSIESKSYNKFNQKT